MRHIQKVIELEGDNNYREGATEKVQRHRFEGDLGSITIPRAGNKKVVRRPAANAVGRQS